jgi:hypothetical protein
VAFDHCVLHLESLLEKYKIELAEGDSTDKEAHVTRKDKVKRVKLIINTEGMRKLYCTIKSVIVHYSLEEEIICRSEQSVIILTNITSTSLWWKIRS